LFVKKGIKNVILAGVHTNMCVIGRSFGLRNMKRIGMNVVLMRDMTDTMYDPASEPRVSHFTGNSLMNEYIEKYVCPTMVSSDLTRKKQFRFKDDNRPIVAFIMAEDEYRADQRLPEFAHDLLLKKNVNCEFAIGKPVAKGEGRHNIENLQILEDADLAVVFARRRALEPDKMAALKRYVESGKPVLGIRTASHAFDPKGNIPREGGTGEAAKDKTNDFLANWTEFDKDILGGNYQGHHGHLKQGTAVMPVPGMEKSVLLKGVDPEGFASPNWLYKNRPLRSNNAQVLLLGSVPGQPAEPVFWVNENKYGKAIYTSLGHWDDWKIESFRNLMFNSVDYLLNRLNQE
jgi:type 1 glutamine amidotransferase